MNSTKKTNNVEARAPSKKINFEGIYSLVMVLAEVPAVYIFATQDNKYLWVLAGVFGIDLAQRLASKFLK